MPEIFGHMPDGDPVYRITLDDGTVALRILTYGAAIQSLDAPDRDGVRANVVLGLLTLEDTIARSPHFGAVPGRYAGRIANGRFSLDGTTYQLEVNSPPNTLHGGHAGFGKRNWTLVDHGPRHVELSIVSPDGDAGFPGTLTAHVRYSLDSATLRFDATAKTDHPTVINLTNHAYFNLGGEGSGDIMGHTLRLDAESFLPLGPSLIPTGERRDVAGTPFDFRTARPIGDQIRTADPQLALAGGYDHHFDIGGHGLRLAATLHHPASGRTLEVETTQPGLQFYSGNNLRGALSGPRRSLYRPGDAVCLETQHPPDSPNHPTFSPTRLDPGATYRQTTLYRFQASGL